MTTVCHDRCVEKNCTLLPSVRANMVSVRPTMAVVLGPNTLVWRSRLDTRSPSCVHAGRA